MPMIVTRQQAADHLRIDDATDEASDLDLKIYAASAVALDYIEMDEEDFETDSDSDYVYPYQLQAAVLLLVGFMHSTRVPGQDTISAGYTQANLPANIRMLLYPLKTFGIEST